MDQTPQVIAQGVRDNIYKDLANLLVQALEKGEITDEEASLSADFIIGRLDTLQTRSELVSFLQELSVRWDIYREAYLTVQKEDLIGKIEQELHQLENPQQPAV